VPDRRAPPVRANPSVLTLSPSRCSMGPIYRRRSFSLHPLSLSVPPSPHVSHPQPPAHNPPPWHPRPRVLRPRPRACAPFEPRALLAHLTSLICALSRAPSLSISLCTRDQRTPPLTVGCCPFCNHRRAHAPSFTSVSSASPLAARDTLRCALPLSGLPGLCSPKQFLCSRSPAVVDPRFHRTFVVLHALRSSHSR
jgi:hypothetical protein